MWPPRDGDLQLESSRAQELGREGREQCLSPLTALLAQWSAARSGSVLLVTQVLLSHYWPGGSQDPGAVGRLPCVSGSFTALPSLCSLFCGSAGKQDRVSGASLG